MELKKKTHQNAGYKVDDHKKDEATECMIIDDDKVACFVDVDGLSASDHSSDYSYSDESSDHDDHYGHSDHSSAYSSEHSDYDDDHHHHYNDHIDKYDSHEKGHVKSQLVVNPFKQSKKKSYKHEVGYRSTKASNHDSAINRKVDKVFNDFEYSNSWMAPKNHHDSHHGHGLKTIKHIPKIESHKHKKSISAHKKIKPRGFAGVSGGHGPDRPTVRRGISGYGGLGGLGGPGG